MAARKDDNVVPLQKRPPAMTPEDREQQLMAAAVDLAEEQIHNGTAATPVIVHYLKLASSREQLEQMRLIEQIKLDQIKAEAIAASAQSAELAEKALAAFKTYTGTVDEDIHRAD